MIQFYRQDGQVKEIFSLILNDRKSDGSVSIHLQEKDFFFFKQTIIQYLCYVLQLKWFSMQ